MLKNKDFCFKLNKEQKSLEFKINTKIYSLTAIYQTAYLFLDKVYVFLDGEPKKEIKVIMKGKEGQEGEDGKERLKKIASEFYNELLNQLLREKVSQTNAKIREYIVAQALYNAVPNEVDELLKEVEEEDWQADPLGIAKTWEESSSAKASASAEATADRSEAKEKKKKAKKGGKR